MLTASSTVQVEKEQASRLSKGGCFLTDIKLRLSKCIDFQFLWLRTKFLHMITSAQACKSFQEGFHADIFGSFKEKASWVQAPPE